MRNRCVSCGWKGGAGYFVLPTKPARRQMWIDALELKNESFRHIKSPRICFRHFKEEDFNTSNKLLTLKRSKNKKVILNNYSNTAQWSAYY